MTSEPTIRLKADDPPIYRAALAALIGTDPSFMEGERVSPPVVPIRPGHEAQQWSALDQLKEAS